MSSVKWRNGKTKLKRGTSRNPFESTILFYGSYTPDHSIFSRNQCHIEHCWRVRYEGNLCKFHYDLEHYRQESAFLDTVRLPDGRLPISSLGSI